ncbi:MAG: amidohydrolase family protein [Proteobacteria bacterium]|nr:amidohydrolase family protein [Pseudomonadota bacterium]
MKVIDAQVHVWGADTPARPWPGGGNPKPHRAEPWTAAELVAAMDAAGVDAAVIVPPGWEGERNDLALAAAADYPGRFAVMGRFDPLLGNPFEAFEQWRDQPGMLGVRFTFHSARGGALLLEPAMADVWAAAERHAIPLMIRALPPMLPVVADIASRHPGLQLALDHLAIPQGATDAAAFAHLPGLLALARHPNIAVKATCMPAYAADPFPHRGLHEPLRAIIDAYGAERVFWGSDVSRLPGSYRDSVLQWTMHMPWLDRASVEAIMGGALSRWLRWPGHASTR